MDEGVIEKLERIYKKEVLFRLLLKDDEGSMITFSKEFSLKDCSLC